MAKDDGGSAFPLFDIRVMNSPEFGMSLRDYFAAKSLPPAVYGMSTNDVRYAAAIAYEIADAMLVERAK